MKLDLLRMLPILFSILFLLAIPCRSSAGKTVASWDLSIRYLDMDHEQTIEVSSTGPQSDFLVTKNSEFPCGAQKDVFLGHMTQARSRMKPLEAQEFSSLEHRMEAITQFHGLPDSPSASLERHKTQITWNHIDITVNSTSGKRILDWVERFCRIPPPAQISSGLIIERQKKPGSKHSALRVTEVENGRTKSSVIFRPSDLSCISMEDGNGSLRNCAFEGFGQASFR